MKNKKKEDGGREKCRVIEGYIKDGAVEGRWILIMVKTRVAGPHQVSGKGRQPVAWSWEGCGPGRVPSESLLVLTNGKGQQCYLYFFLLRFEVF